MSRLAEIVGVDFSPQDEVPEPPAPTPTPHLALVRTPAELAFLATPPLPSADLGQGQVWPPDEGRKLLREAEPGAAIPRIRPSGDWTARRGPWYFHSGVQSRYEDEPSAREALLAWARWHSAVRSSLSPHRALALVPAEDGSWRLWQVVRGESSLAREISQVLENEPPEIIVPVLLEAVRVLEDAFSRLIEAHLPVTLQTIGVVGTSPVYIGTVPSPRGFEVLKAHGPARPLDLVRLLAPVLEASSLARSVKHTRVVDALLEVARTPAYQERALNIVSAITSL